MQNSVDYNSSMSIASRFDQTSIASGMFLSSAAGTILGIASIIGGIWLLVLGAWAKVGLIILGMWLWPIIWSFASVACMVVVAPLAKASENNRNMFKIALIVSGVIEILKVFLAYVLFINLHHQYFGEENLIIPGVLALSALFELPVLNAAGHSMKNGQQPTLVEMVTVMFIKFYTVAYVIACWSGQPAIGTLLFIAIAIPNLVMHFRAGLLSVSEG